MKDNTRGHAPQWGGNGNLGKFTIRTKELESSDVLEMVKEPKVAELFAAMLNGQTNTTLVGQQVVAAVKAAVKEELESGLEKGQSLPKQEEWMAVGKPIAQEWVKDYLNETVFDFKALILADLEKERKAKLSPLDAMVKDLCDKREAAGKDRNEALIREKVAAILALKDME